MTYTLVLLVSRKPTLSIAAFKHHYETIHIPVLKSIVGPDFPLSHTRHYIERDEKTANVFIGSLDDFQFDAFAVLTFGNQAHWERFLAKVKQPHNAIKLAEDDDRFLDYSKMRAVFAGDTKATGRDGVDMGWRFVAAI
ncbi:hypothetical protein BS50DRAFT_569606 [Corynespora cassiicola Philippines]|uniref:EthD domain-containing protein n=1 Tax=Corynespora cassiicola Philippines TaxID=1448308 RepID=A0A2T2P2W7_CORCC|nr:hypothetical protein BS50DRAFT_569606 [Corynespora cassiicola Philippines]